MKQYIVNTLFDAQSMLARFIADEGNVETIEAAALALIESLDNGGAIYSCGNGGSMSDAMHFAEELTGRYRLNRMALSATAISDPGHLSCVANDFGYEHVFSRYLEARGRAGDALLAISTSGSSRNVINAAELARSRGMSVISLTGAAGSELGDIATVDLCVGSSQFADRIQEMHIKLIHTLIELIERKFCPENYPGDA